jgi:hypothetical protein
MRPHAAPRSRRRSCSLPPRALLLLLAAAAASPGRARAGFVRGGVGGGATPAPSSSLAEQQHWAVMGIVMLGSASGVMLAIFLTRDCLVCLGRVLVALGVLRRPARGRRSSDGAEADADADALFAKHGAYAAHYAQRRWSWSSCSDGGGEEAAAPARWAERGGWEKPFTV